MNKIGLTTTVVSDLAWEQLVQIDNPPNTPVAATVAGVAPVQSWEETDQVLPDIGDVDNKLLGAAGLSNTILISTTTKEVLETITVSIGANGNWYVGIQDTGIAAKGTDEKTIARPTGVYGSAVVYRQGNDLHIGGGLAFSTKEGPSYYTMTTTSELVIPVTNTTTFVTIDRFGTTRTYDAAVNLWLIPESQALIALVVDVVDGVNVLAVPTVHNAMLMATAVIPYSQEAIAAAATATTQAILAGQQATAAAASAAAAALSESAAAATAVQVTADKQATLGYKNDAQAAAAAAATSEQNAHTFADYADADRVATNADRAQVASDKAAVASDKSTVATDKGIVAADKALVLGYKNDALASKNLALEYAIKPENSIISGTISDYSALHWAAKAQQWAQAVSSALVWKGSWSAAGNTAPPTPVVGSGAHFYRISAAGTINSVTYEVGDYIHWDTTGLVWFKIDGTDAVMTVNSIAPVGGNVSITTITGNAGTATKLQTARTIGGVSFDGSADINLPGVNAAGTQSTTGNAATATKLQTARTIAGKSFDGTANITLAASDVGAVPQARTINSKPLTADITLSAADVGAAPAGFGLGEYGRALGSVLGDTSLRRQSGFYQGSNIEGLPTSPHEWNYVFNQAHANAAGFFGYLAINFDCSKAWIGGQSGGVQKGPFELVKQGDRFVANSAMGNNYYQCAIEVNGNTAIDSRPGIGFHMSNRFASTLHLWEGGDFRFHTQGLDSYAGIMTGNVNANDVYIRSDRRLKKNFVEVRDALRKVSALTAYSYDKKQTLEATEYDKKEVGLIAQDVEQVLPEAVTRVVDSSNKDGTEILTLSNSALIALLVEAVKELSEKVKELEHGRT